MDVQTQMPGIIVFFFAFDDGSCEYLYGCTDIDMLSLIHMLHLMMDLVSL